MADVDFRAAALMDEARAQSGLGDFGEDNFRPALATFVKACREDSYVDPAGLPDIAASIVRILVNRLRFEEILKRHSARSEEHTSELQSLMRISYAVFCLKKKKKK